MKKIRWRKKWREIAKEWSTWALVIGAVVPTIHTIVMQINMTPGLELLVATPFWQVFSVVVGVAGIIVKNIPQSNIEETNNVNDDQNTIE